MESMQKAGKTPCTFRISSQAKLALSAAAIELGMSASQYIEALVTQQHDLFVNSLEAKLNEKKIVFSEEMYSEVLKHLEKLKKRYPEASQELLIASSLDHAYSNRGALVQRRLDVFLKRNLISSNI